MSSNPRCWAIIYLLAAFAVGLMAGILVGFAIARVPPPGPPGVMAERIRARLASELRLTEVQTQQIVPIVDELVRQMNAEHERTVDRMVQIIHQAHQRMETCLTPAQLEKFRLIQQEREEAFRRAAGAGPVR